MKIILKRIHAFSDKYSLSLSPRLQVGLLQLELQRVPRGHLVWTLEEIIPRCQPARTMPKAIFFGGIAAAQSSQLVSYAVPNILIELNYDNH